MFFDAAFQALLSANSTCLPLGADISSRDLRSPQLVPGQSGWTANVLQSFVCTGGLNGCFPQALIFDPAGNLIGAMEAAGHNRTGTVIKLLASDNWSIDLLYTFASNEGGVSSRLTMDAAGNLYGTSDFCETGHGCVFKLTPSGNGYVYSELYNFSET